MHFGLHTHLCPSIAPLDWGTEKWSPKAVSAQWRIGHKSLIGSKITAGGPLSCSVNYNCHGEMHIAINPCSLVAGLVPVQ